MHVPIADNIPYKPREIFISRAIGKELSCGIILVFWPILHRFLLLYHIKLFKYEIRPQRYFFLCVYLSLITVPAFALVYAFNIVHVFILLRIFIHVRNFPKSHSKFEILKFD